MAGGVGHRLQPAGGNDVVRVAVGQQLASSRDRPGVARGGVPTPRPAVDQRERLKALAVAPGQIRGAVGGSVVDNHQLPVAVVPLGGERLELLGERRGGVVGGDDHAD